MRLTLATALAVAIGALAVDATDAVAYPQLQFTTGATRCGECHVAPSGGGLLTDYGRDEAGDTLSGRGDGRLLYGAWTPPSWLALGGDLRVAGGGKQLADEPVTGLAFPMQADLNARVAAGPVALHLTVGGNGAARGRPDAAPITNYLVSRQHYLEVAPSEASWSARLGRFYPTLGLRLADHTAYPRRHLGLYLLEEPYALEGRYTTGPWEGFASVFVGNPLPELAAGPRASGGALYLERLLGASGAVAGQARVTLDDGDRRVLLGAVGKRYWDGPKLQLLGEVDLQRQDLDGFVRYQLVGYLGVTRAFLPGYLLGAAVQRFAPDVSFAGTTRNAVEVNAQAFPWAHTEAHLLLRAEATGGDTFHPNWLALLQLHYYL